MSIPSMVCSEIAHRKLSFLISVAAVAVAVASSIGVLTKIRAHQIQTAAKVAEMDDQIRKITKDMGFNVTILPREQNLVDFHANDFGEKTMPKEFVDRLAGSQEVFTIQHLRPALVRKLSWPEQNRQVLLMGVSGVVPFAHRNPKKPLSQPVPKGTMNVGNVLASELGIQEGQEVMFHQRPFQVAKIYKQRGTKDDITVWIDLEEAQQILNLPDQISMIQALECNCASIDRLAEIQAEISNLLGDEVRVIEFTTTAIARAKAREGVKAEGRESVARLERLAAFLVPLSVVGASLLVGLLTWANVRERRSEVGILRAIGVGSSRILGLFVTKAFAVGLLGAAIGYVVGFQGSAMTSSVEVADGAVRRMAAGELFEPHILGLVLVATPLLAILASWVPALLAAGQDPALVLREE